MSSYKYINKLQAKRVLIFGGTSGIGFGVAEASIENGAEVIIAGSKPEKLENAVTRLTKSYPDIQQSRITTHVIDLSALDKVESALEQLSQKVTSNGSTKLDHVVFTAGDWGSSATFDSVTINDIHPFMGVRLLVPILMAKFIPQYLHATAESSFTVTSGTNTARPEKGFALQAVTGGGSEALVRGLAVAYAPIRCNCVSPGLIATEATAGLIKGAASGVIEKSVLTGRYGRTEDVVEAYLYLMKDSFVTGQTLSSDGGRLLLGPDLGLKSGNLNRETK